MAERFVRITMNWDVAVAAEYGDTDESLVEKASRPTLAEGRETRTLLPPEITAQDVVVEEEVA